MKFPWRNELDGFSQAGPGLVGALLEQHQEEEESHTAQRRVREQAEDRTRNSLGMRPGEQLTPTQLALAEAHERLLHGDVGPVNPIEKTGGFSLDRSGRDPQVR
jgi:hypothetical protein